MRATRFVDLELSTIDVPGQLAFYRDVLGLPVAATPRGFELHAGDTTLRFVESSYLSAPAHVAFNIPADGLDLAIAVLEDDVRWLPDVRGQERHDFPAWEAEAVYFTDRAENVIELIARRAAGPFDGRGAGPAHVLGVSELGVVVDDVAGFGREIAERSGLRWYGRSSPSFTALGDPRGLLIVVERDRPWFPENVVPARPVRTRATLETPQYGDWHDADGLVELMFVPPSAPPAH